MLKKRTQACLYNGHPLSAGIQTMPLLCSNCSYHPHFFASMHQAFHLQNQSTHPPLLHCWSLSNVLYLSVRLFWYQCLLLSSNSQRIVFMQSPWISMPHSTNPSLHLPTHPASSKTKTLNIYQFLWKSLSRPSCLLLHMKQCAFNWRGSTTRSGFDPLRENI